VPSTTEKIAVIGAGVMGLGAAAELSRRGFDVEVFERADIGNSEGGSGGIGRIFRTTYPEPEAVRSLIEAGRLWDELERTLGLKLRSAVSGLDYGDDVITAGFAEALNREEVQFRFLTDDETAERWPSLRFSGRVLEQADGALIHSERVLPALCEYLEQRSALINRSTTVDRIVQVDAGVELVVNGNPRRFDRVVVCAGAGTNALCDGILDLPAVRITQEFTLSFDLEPEAEPFPVACDYRKPSIHGDSYFWLPSEPGRMKLGVFASGVEVAPGPPQCPAALADELYSYAAATFAANGELINSELTPCTYDFSPDEWFFADATAGARVVAVGGFSGHGYKFAPSVAIAIAEIIDSDGLKMPSGLPWTPSLALV